MPLPLELGQLAEERLQGLASLAVNLAQIEPGHVVLTTVSSTEAYVDAVLRALIAQSGYDRIPFARAMFVELEDRILQSWPERHAWLAKGFGVSIADDRASGDLSTLVELRNALVHGNGHLTERQSRDVVALIALEARLRSIFQVTVEGRRVHLQLQTGELAVRAAQAYIRALDAEARRQHPSAHL